MLKYEQKLREETSCETWSYGGEAALAWELTERKRRWGKYQAFFPLSSPSGDWNARIGIQEIPRVTGKFGLGVQNEAGQRLTEFCQEYVLVITPSSKNTRRLYTWTSSDDRYPNQIDSVLCGQRWRSSIQSAKIRPGADGLRS